MPTVLSERIYRDMLKMCRGIESTVFRGSDVYVSNMASSVWNPHREIFEFPSNIAEMCANMCDGLVEVKQKETKNMKIDNNEIERVIWDAITTSLKNHPENWRKWTSAEVYEHENKVQVWLNYPKNNELKVVSDGINFEFRQYSYKVWIKNEIREWEKSQIHKSISEKLRNK